MEEIDGLSKIDTILADLLLETKREKTAADRIRAAPHPASSTWPPSRTLKTFGHRLETNKRT
jgi:hypothetical protein